MNGRFRLIAGRDLLFSTTTDTNLDKPLSLGDLLRLVSLKEIRPIANDRFIKLVKNKKNRPIITLRPVNLIRLHFSSFYGVVGDVKSCALVPSYSRRSAFRGHRFNSSRSFSCEDGMGENARSRRLFQLANKASLDSELNQLKERLVIAGNNLMRIRRSAPRVVSEVVQSQPQPHEKKFQRCRRVSHAVDVAVKILHEESHQEKLKRSLCRIAVLLGDEVRDDADQVLHIASQLFEYLRKSRVAIPLGDGAYWTRAGQLDILKFLDKPADKSFWVFY